MVFAVGCNKSGLKVYTDLLQGLSKNATPCSKLSVYFACSARTRSACFLASGLLAADDLIWPSIFFVGSGLGASLTAALEGA